MFRRALLIGTLLACTVVQALSFSNAYVSPRNKERAVRKRTDYIILHTTEAEATSSLRKLSRNGEAHYCVTRDGKVYRIVDRNRVAYHCGTSMWSGRTGIDEYSVGIEVVGYHDRALTAAQYTALRKLILALQKIYSVKDANVMPHSQVAYGRPNRWHRRNHRGRKRCGMGYATPSVRKLLGLKERWLVDPDVKAKRLTVGDTFLSQILYSKQGDKLLPYRLPAVGGKTKKTAVAAKPKTAAAPEQEQLRTYIIRKGMSAWDVARDAYDAATTLYIFPDGKRLAGNRIRDWESLVAGTKVQIGERVEGPSVYTLAPGEHAKGYLGEAAFAADTWYIRPTGGRVQGSSLNTKTIAALPPGTKILAGYTLGGPVTSKRLPAQICPTRWDAQDTYYLLPGKPLAPYKDVDIRRIPAGTYIFYRQ